MIGRIALLAFSVFALSAPLGAEAACQLCAPQMGDEAGKPRAPLTIEIQSGLDFSRMVQDGAAPGEASVDPKSGSRSVSGGLVPLGGAALTGTVLIVGEPNAPVRITLPERIQMRSASGAVAEVVKLETDLPVTPVLGADGRLRFSFGGRLLVKGAVSGAFRGSILISADYE